jgi:hypothetical protein
MLNSSIQNVTVKIPFSFQLIVTTNCPQPVSVVDILSFALLNIIKGLLIQIGKGQTWTMNVQWTPTSQQVGLQLLCMVAIDR